MLCCATARVVLPDLAAYQDAFVAALDDPAAATLLAPLVDQPGFKVYRNTVLRGCIDALQANYPAVTRLVGEAWFRATAAEYVRQRPPTQPALVDYGDGFAAFLAAFEPARELPYLADVAAIERCWTEAYAAADEAPLTARALARLTPQETASTVLMPHCAARWHWSEQHPAYRLWSANRTGAAPSTPQWRGEGALLVRPGDRVESLEISVGGCAFLDACARGADLTRAAAAAQAVQPAIDLAALMAQLLNAGAFAARSLANGDQPC
jgi:hypothetical protein